MKKYDRSLLFFLDIEQKQQGYKEMYKIANRRINELRKRDLLNESIAARLDVKRFPKEYTEHNYMEVVRFLSAETSTIRGVKKVRKKIKKLFESAGIVFTSDKMLRDFVLFLQSKEYQMLKKKYDSEEIIDDFVESFSQNKSIAEILEEYRISDFTERNGVRLL